MTVIAILVSDRSVYADIINSVQLVPAFAMQFLGSKVFGRVHVAFAILKMIAIIWLCTHRSDKLGLPT